MPEIGQQDDFEANYMADLKAAVTRYGVLVEYPRDRAALDLGLHLKHVNDGKIEITQVRVWMQAKGIRAATLDADAWESASHIPVSGLAVEHVRFWYGSPEPVYLVLFVEAAGAFLATDIRGLVDHLGGLPHLMSLGAQRTMTLNLPKTATLDVALAGMPLHRSMRIDGPAFRGRPLGHNYDPLRSELNSLPPPEFVELTDGLLQAHEFRSESESPLAGGILTRLGKLYLTYEWVLPMMTEFGFDAGSDFRIEGEPFNAHGEVLVIMDPRGTGPGAQTEKLRRLAELARDRGATDALIFINVSEADLIRSFAAWRQAVKPLRSMPQSMGSLTFNVLTTTNLYLQVAAKLTYKSINYQY